jgi:hypothetical protein
LPGSTVITLAIPSTVTDLSGNALADFTSEFTTAAAFDTTHASVATQRPGNGATGVLVNASPVVLFVTKPLNAGTVTGAMHISQAGQVVPGTVAIVGNGQTIEFTPSSSWTYGSLVDVYLDTTAVDTSGNTVNAYHGTFTVAGDPALTAPAVLNDSPINGATGVPLNGGISWLYSEPLDPATVNPKLQGSVAGAVTLDQTGTVIHAFPNPSWSPNTRYCYSGLSTYKGVNGLAAQNLQTCFTTGTTSQATPPTVTAVSPADKLAGVPVNARISLAFSGPIDPTTVNGSTVQLSGGGQTLMPASISFTNNNQTVEITPQAPLPVSTLMTLTISGVTDVAGNPVATQATHFITGTTAATAAPGVVAVNPLANATGVPVNVAVSLQANVAIDSTSVTTSTFRVLDNTLSQSPVSGAYSLSADGGTAYFLPVAQLAANHNFSVYFNGYGMTDLAGDALASCSNCFNNFSFTTGTAASTSAPQVTGVTPSNGTTQVPINSQIVIAFNEPVNAESLGQITLTANGSTAGLTESLSNGNQTLTLVPTAGLTANTVYTLTIVGVMDVSGNTMSTSFSATFTTNGTVAKSP